MMKMAVKGIGVAGGFGCGVADLKEALERGSVPAGELTVPTGQGPRQLQVLRAETSRLDEFIPRRTLRRVDHFSKLGLLGASLALSDAGMLGSNLDRVGVVIASGYGATATTFAFLDSIIADGDICASPTHFANSVHNAAAANISILLGARGPSLTVSQSELSVASALISAQQWLAEGRVDAVLLGAIDELSDLVGYLRLRRTPEAGEAQGTVLGEGTAFFVLTRHDDASAYCCIDSVEMGVLRVQGISVPDDALVIVGDACGDLAKQYRSLVPAHACSACYAPLYGSMPAGAAFDLAASALALRPGQTYPIPGATLSQHGALSRVCALRVTAAGEYAAVNMSGGVAG